jgi:anti-sigma B factor antagonist
MNELTVHSGGPPTVVDLRGEIDVATAGDVRTQIWTLVRNGQHELILDLDQVTFMDSSGLGMLVSGLRRVQHHGGYLELVCSQERLLMLFRITGLNETFRIHDTVAAALSRPVPL